MKIDVYTEETWFGRYKVELLIDATTPGNILRYEHSPYRVMRNHQYATRRELLEAVVALVVTDHHWFRYSQWYNIDWFTWIFQNQEQFVNGLIN